MYEEQEKQYIENREKINIPQEKRGGVLDKLINELRYDVADKSLQIASLYSCNISVQKKLDLLQIKYNKGEKKLKQTEKALGLMGYALGAFQCPATSRCKCSRIETGDELKDVSKCQVAYFMEKAK